MMLKTRSDARRRPGCRALLMLALAVPALSGCSTLPKPDARAALMAPCANAADKYPWQLTDTWDDGDSYMPQTRFYPNGVLAYAYQDSTFENGRWVLNGEDLSIDMNDHYSDYTGSFNGETARGTMKNRVGNAGKWSLARACDN